MFKFQMTIGDWRLDGHEKSESFLIESNHPIEKVREIHFAAPEATGIDIEDICSGYGENWLSDEVIGKLKELGFSFDCFSREFPTIYPDELIKIWIFLLQKTDPTLSLSFCKEDYPEFHFCGFDEKNRHINAIGYGLFS